MGTFKHNHNSTRGAFIYEVDGKALGEMAYVMAGPQRMIIEHTEVDESLKGQNIGKRLLGELVNYVREQNIKVIPVCPFAKAMLEKITEWQDILQKPSST